MRNLFLPRLRYMAIPAVIMLRFFTSCTPAVYEMQPAISWGGRVVSLTRSPSSDNDIIAAAESGGLFHSSNGGKSWTHLELPVFYMQDVKYAPWDPNVVVATSKRDLKKKKRWRSLVES